MRHQLRLELLHATGRVLLFYAHNGGRLRAVVHTDRVKRIHVVVFNGHSLVAAGGGSHIAVSSVDRLLGEPNHGV
jgi:hypothetical protein